MTSGEISPGPVVVDTSVVSILFRQNSERFDYYQNALVGYELLISFQTFEEMLFGAYNANWGERRISELTDHLASFIVIYPNRQLVDISAQLRSETRDIGRELERADAWIAATALMLDCPLAADDGDFETVPNLALIRYRTG